MKSVRKFTHKYGKKTDKLNCQNCTKMGIVPITDVMLNAFLSVPVPAKKS